jgi:cell division septal protein FtsQ
MPQSVSIILEQYIRLAVWNRLADIAAILSNTNSSQTSTPFYRLQKSELLLLFR